MSATARVVAPADSAPAERPMLTVPVVSVLVLLSKAVFVSIAPKVSVEVALLPVPPEVSAFESVTVPPFTLLTTVPMGTPNP